MGPDIFSKEVSQSVELSHEQVSIDDARLANSLGLSARGILMGTAIKLAHMGASFSRVLSISLSSIMPQMTVNF